MKKDRFSTDYYDYYLPEELIAAQTPIKDRSHSRLLVLDRLRGNISHKRFDDIVDYLDSNDVLVLNNTKVLPSRIFGIKDVTGAKIETLLLKQIDNDIWECLVSPQKRLKVGTIINYSELPKRRVDLTFNLSYSADSKKVKDIIKNAINENELVLKDEDIFVRTTAYGASGIDYTLRVWTKSKDYWTVYFDLLEGVKEELDKAGIEIPFNQLDVHVIN